MVDNDLYEISKIYRHIYFNCFLVFLWGFLKTSQSEQIQKVDQEFIQYLDKEIANPQLYFHPDVVKCILKNASEISAPFKSYVNDKQGFGKEGFESEDIIPPAILEDYQKFVNQYCM